MWILSITISDDVDRQACFRFSESPVRIGRSPLSDFVVDFPWVSQFHSLIHFGDQGVHYVDLGARNPTLLGGQPAPAHEATAVGPTSDVRIGPLQLSFICAEGAADEESWPYFGSQDTAGSTTSPPQTIQLQESSPSAVEHAPLTLHQSSLIDGVRAKCSATLTAASAASSDSAQDNAAPRAPSPACSPETASSAESQAPAVEASSGETTEKSLPEMLSHLFSRLGDGPEWELVLALAEIAEVSAAGVVALRTGRTALGEELGVATLPPANRSRPIDTPQEMLEWLLFHAKPARRARELSGEFGDILAHETALIGAVRMGVEELLERLHPTQGAFAQRRRGLAGLFGIKDYTAFFEEETSDPRQAIFGDAFEHAYAASCRCPAEGVLKRAGSETLPPPEIGPVGGTICALPAEAAAGNSRPALARLVITSQADRGAEFLLERPMITIGRDEQNVITLKHSSVSWHHAILARKGDSWVVTDGGSKNGILVNGARLKTCCLRNGDLLDIGAVQFRFEIRNNV